MGLRFHQKGEANREWGSGLSPSGQSLFQCLSLAWSQTDLKLQIKPGQLKFLLLLASLLFFLTNVVTVGAVLMDTAAAAPCGFPGYLQKPSQTPGSHHVKHELSKWVHCRIWVGGAAHGTSL